MKGTRIILATVWMLSACAVDIPPETARACIVSEASANSLAGQVDNYIKGQLRVDGILDESFLVGTRYLLDREAGECESNIALVMQLPRALTPRNEIYLKGLFTEAAGSIQ